MKIEHKYQYKPEPQSERSFMAVPCTSEPPPPEALNLKNPPLLLRDEGTKQNKNASAYDGTFFSWAAKC